MNISIIIPAYNEEKRIIPSLIKINSFMKEKKYDFEIIVVDDGSKDNMVEKINATKIKSIKIIRNEKNMGKGYSVRKGISHAKKKIILITDSDLATPIEELDKLAKHIDKYDIVIASRNMKDSKIVVTQPLYRQMLGKIFPFIVNILLIRKIKDTQCGFKLLNTKIAKKIAEKERIDGFAFDVELLFIARKNKYTIKEIGITWHDKKGSTVNPVKDAFKMFIDIIRIRMNHLKGYYKIP